MSELMPSQPLCSTVRLLTSLLLQDQKWATHTQSSAFGLFKTWWNWSTAFHRDRDTQSLYTTVAFTLQRRERRCRSSQFMAQRLITYPEWEKRDCIFIRGRKKRSIGPPQKNTPNCITGQTVMIWEWCSLFKSFCLCKLMLLQIVAVQSITVTVFLLWCSSYYWHNYIITW